MKIGILSDSHGKSDRLQAAISALTERQVKAIVHCGDISRPDAIHQLADTGLDIHVVAGNMDHHLDTLAEAAGNRGVHFSSEVVEVPLGNGRHLIATHGDDQRVLGELVADQQFPYICHGHTHRRRDDRIGNIRIINPGALYHPKHPHVPSVAVLDTDDDTVEWIDVDT